MQRGHLQMLSQIKKRNEGFTIIEVLIVLAIAGLILLIVFLAVPALQRGQRNTARKNDIARVGGAATEFVSNNNGTLPTASNGATAGSNAATIVNSAGNLSQYVAANINVVAGAASNAAVGNLTTVNIVTNAKCTSAGAASSTGATSRQMVIQYGVETSGGGTNPVCQDI